MGAKVEICPVTSHLGFEPEGDFNNCKSQNIVFKMLSNPHEVKWKTDRDTRSTELWSFHDRIPVKWYEPENPWKNSESLHYKMPPSNLKTDKLLEISRAHAGGNNFPALLRPDI